MMTQRMATIARPVPVVVRLQRRDAVDSALTDLRLEGLQPTPRALSMFESFVRGEISEDELLDLVLAQ
jgi:hypothetical protein